MFSQGIFRKDWALKLFSLGFGLFLWFFVVGEEKAEVSISVPLELVNVPSGLVIANDIPSAIDIRVYGPRSMVRSLAVQNILRVIDLRDATPGGMTVHITPDSLSLPRGVRPMRIQPGSVEIELEPLVYGDLPVKPVFSGAASKDYEVVRTEVNPSRVVLAGPSSEIESLEYVKTVPVSLNGATDNVTRKVGLDIEGLHVMSENMGTFQVTAYVTPVQMTRRITHVPVQLETTMVNVSWWPKIVGVVIQGTVADLRDVKVSDIDVRISASGLEPGIHSVEPRCTVPEKVFLLSVIPNEVRVTVPE